MHDKISKAQSDKFTAQSSRFDAEAQVTKLENDYTSYEMRNDSVLYQSTSKWLYQ